MYRVRIGNKVSVVKYDLEKAKEIVEELKCMFDMEDITVVVDHKGEIK